MNKEFVVVRKYSCAIPAVRSQLFNVSCSIYHKAAHSQPFNLSCLISAVPSQLFNPICSIPAVLSQMFTVAVQF